MRAHPTRRSRRRPRARSLRSLRTLTIFRLIPVLALRILALFVLLAVLRGGPSPAAAQPGTGDTGGGGGATTTTRRPAGGVKIEINPSGYTSARTCGRCHVDIYNSWKKSLHAFSLSDPIFDTAYMQAIKEGGDQAKRLCLRCHAPLTMHNQDYDLNKGVTREGVSCDFCHTVTAVNLDATERRYETDPGIVKRGIIKHAGSPAHDVAYSDLHGTAEFCGGCHNYTAPDGTPIMSTYDEWLAGPYAREGVQCQDCHMALGTGTVVSQEIKKTGPEVHLHDLIHDTGQLRSALAVQIKRAERTSEGLQVEVGVKNVGSGHKVPTGMPTREIVLTVSVHVGDHEVKRERRYRKVLADAKGKRLKSDYEALLYGAKVLTDSRIAPREERLERFTFTVPGSGSVKISAAVSYVYAPMVLDQRRLDVRLAHAERFVR